MSNKLFILSNNKVYWGIMFLFTLIYLRGLFTFIYGIDASIYASLSAEMSETGSWLQLYHKGSDYLDKPPLHFWLSSLSFKLFGLNSFAYKLPSFLFTVLGTYSTYKLGRLLYTKQIGKLSALLFYSCFSILLINLDVRTDTVLIGIIIYTIWQLIAYVKTNNYLNFILGFIGIGFAMLAKGPIGLMVPVLALGSHFLIHREWKNIFKWQWILGLLISALVISPMLWGLYTQFDLQPTKSFRLASGMEGKGTSGLKFYLWDQSFGRITGSNKEWKNDSSIFFFTHTFLWSFLPWSILGVLGLFKKIKTAFTAIPNHEFFTLGAILIPFLAFSKSQFQLPHYIYVLFPFWMILTGWYYAKLSPYSAWFKIIKVIHTILNFAFVGVALLVLIYIYPTKSMWIWIPFLLTLLGTSYLYFKTKSKDQLLLTTLASFFGVVFIFNFYFIPKTLEYDGFHKAAIESKDLPINSIYSNTIGSLAFDVYSGKTVTFLELNELKEYVGNNNYVFIKGEDIEYMKSNFELTYIKQYTHHSATHITANFLNPETRGNTLETFYLVGI